MVLVVAVLIIGAAITSTGVLYRLALESIALCGADSRRSDGASLAGLLIGPAVPNGTSRVIMIAPMLGTGRALGYRPQSKAAAGLAMAVLIGFGQMARIFHQFEHGSVGAGGAAGRRARRRELDYVVLYGAPTNIILFIGLSRPYLALPAAGNRAAGLEQAGRSRRAATRCSANVAREARAGRGLGDALGFVTEPLTAWIHPGLPFWQPACWRQRAS
jgi:hypothetical protein